ncbi:hypothetical protein [Weissella tructae]
MRKKGLYLLTILSASTLIPLTAPIALADTHTSTHESAQNVQPVCLADFDHLVSVHNNQYVLATNNDAHISQNTYTQLEKAVTTANQTIAAHHFTIDPETKEMYTEHLRVPRAANSRYTYKNFWWGTRYYFRSNQAVDQLVHELQSHGSDLSIGGLVGSIIASRGIAAVGALSSVYFQRVANNLNYYNARHRKNQIYMDWNYSGQYSMHILR